MSNRRKRLAFIFYALFITFYGVIVYLSLSPDAIFIANIKHIDKVMHFLSYGILAAFLSIANIYTKHHKCLRITVMMSWVALVITAGLTELWHDVIPGRTGSIWDLAANLFGICTGFLSVTLLLRIKAVKRLLAGRDGKRQA